MLTTEERLIELAQRRVPGQTAPRRTIEDVLTLHPEVGLDQADAVRELAGGFGPVRVMVARAGTGKTYTLDLVRETLDAAGIEVTGCSWQGQAAQLLETQAGIPSRTIASLLGEIEYRPEIALPMHGVLVIDEAGTVPTRALTRLMEYAAERDVTVLLVGDPRQLPSIDAGGALQSIAIRCGSVELTENRRQVGELQQEVAASLANGNAARAIELLADHGRLNAYPTPDAARHALIDAWVEHGLRDPSRTLILAHDRVDVAELNTLARERMDQAGLLGPDRLTARGREWAEGDRLVCRKNDYRQELDVRNGTRATVTGIDPDAREITIRTDEGRTVRCPEDYLEYAHHAYATTGHISQGLTVDRTYLLATPERGGQEWGYVAGSRHRVDLHLYTTGINPDLAAAALSGGWQRTQAKSLAIDHIQTASRVPEQAFAIGGPLRPRTPRVEPPTPPFTIGGPRNPLEHPEVQPEPRIGPRLRPPEIEPPGIDLDLGF